ncbi:MAG: NAD(P)/FAD-dependent oxidoreductase, partial [Candidatus Sericytochromatia bacterium]
GLKTIEDATEIRRKILLAFEAAEREPDSERRRALLRFVVVGGGPTGVELAGALGEISRQTLRHDFRQINPADAEILLVEAMDRILLPYDPGLSAKAKTALEELGVKVMLKAMVTDVQADHLKLKLGDQEQVLPTHNVLWGAGVQASPLGQVLHKATGVVLDRAGRVTIEPDLSLAGHENIFAIGDLSLFTHQTGKPLPGVAPVAMQMGEYVARLISEKIRNPAFKPKPFHYFDKGSMSTIGRSKAVAQTGSIKLSGFLAWMMWLFIHLLFLVRFENRILVLLQWAWNYVTRNRSARLITGEKSEIMPVVSTGNAAKQEQKIG